MSKTFMDEVRELYNKVTKGVWELKYSKTAAVDIEGVFIGGAHVTIPEVAQIYNNQANDFALIALAPQMAEKLIAIDDLIAKYNLVDRSSCGIGTLGKLNLVDDIKQILEQTIDKQE